MSNSEEIYKEGLKVLETISRDKQEIFKEGLEMLSILRKENPTVEEMKAVDDYLIKIKRQQAQRTIPASKRDDITKEIS